MNKWLIAVIAGLVLSQIAAFATTIYLHRGAAHRGIRFHKVADVFFRFMLWITTGIVTKRWVAVHRKHHAHMDTDEDPHSPARLGFWKVQLGNLFLYRKAAANIENIKKYASDFVDDWWDKWIFNHNSTGLLLGIAVLCVTLGVWGGLVAAGTHTFTYIFLLSASINGLCHVHGKRNFNNDARNIQSVALLTGGEGLHNNHHAFPACPKLSMKSFEFDPAWMFIWVMKKLKLCRHGKTIKIDAPQVHPTLTARMFKHPSAA